jgi:hypothetical protein
MKARIFAATVLPLALAVANVGAAEPTPVSPAVA